MDNQSLSPGYGRRMRQYEFADMDRFPGTYTDSNGSEQLSFTNDGKTLQFRVRGVAFRGGDFDSFEPVDGAPSNLLSQFTLNQNGLCDCRIQCEMPVVIVCGAKEIPASLVVTLELDGTDDNGGVAGERLQLTLSSPLGDFSSPGADAWFETELNEIQSQLPADAFLRTCINCRYSDYSPAGHGMFGDMMCFRNIKSDYLAVNSKQDFWPLATRCDRTVQETYHCDEFERRTPGTGYRG